MRRRRKICEVYKWKCAVFVGGGVLVCQVNTSARKTKQQKSTTIWFREYVVAGVHPCTASVTSPSLSRRKTGGTSTRMFAEPLGFRDVAKMIARFQQEKNDDFLLGTVLGSQVLFSLCGVRLGVNT